MPHNLLRIEPGLWRIETPQGRIGFRWRRGRIEVWRDGRQVATCRPHNFSSGTPTEHDIRREISRYLSTRTQEISVPQAEAKRVG